MSGVYDIPIGFMSANVGKQIGDFIGVQILM